MPLALHFNGVVYYPNEAGGLQMVLIPWSSSVGFRMPVDVWRETVERYYPNTGWVGLRRRRSRSSSAAGCRVRRHPRCVRALLLEDRTAWLTPRGWSRRSCTRATRSIRTRRGRRRTRRRRRSGSSIRLPTRPAWPAPTTTWSCAASCDCEAAADRGRRGALPGAGGRGHRASSRAWRAARDRPRAARAGARDLTVGALDRRAALCGRAGRGRRASSWCCGSRTARLRARARPRGRAGPLAALDAPDPARRGALRLPARAAVRERQHLPGAGHADDDAVVGAAIVLPDHPQIAPESRGGLFDSTEIEEALLLHVQVLSDGEREEIARPTRRCGRWSSGRRRSRPASSPASTAG